MYPACQLPPTLECLEFVQGSKARYRFSQEMVTAGMLASLSDSLTAVLLPHSRESTHVSTTVGVSCFDLQGSGVVLVDCELVDLGQQSKYLEARFTRADTGGLMGIGRHTLLQVRLKL